MIVGPRVEFQHDERPRHYPRIRVYDPRAGKDRYLYLHRLTLYAQGEVEDLWGSWHGHHKDADGWNNRPENLEAVDPEEHERHEPQVANLRAPPEREVT